MSADTDPIDVHTHLFPSTLVAELRRRSEAPCVHDVGGGEDLLEFSPGVKVPLFPEIVDLNVKLERMSRGGIGFGIISVATSRIDLFRPSDADVLARAVNDELAEIERSHENLAALALLPMHSGEAAATELERAVGLGLRGAIVESNVAGRPLDDARFHPIFDAAAALDAPLFLHPNQPSDPGSVDVYGMLPVVGFLMDTTIATLRLIFSGVFERHPGLKLYVAHTGSLIPYMAGRLDEFFKMDRLPSGSRDGAEPPSYYVSRLYTDTVCASTATLQMAAAFFQPDRIMWGSDAPYFAIDTAVETLEGARLSPAMTAGIRAENARKLFKL